ncbi:hypothetical protein M885DRAFT_510464 [Pelagophyceae sp. CCMP2097]|nr:hypothetical protein M885DRAFT_510464 [Pelagophyceae sp. CCMP2097]
MMRSSCDENSTTSGACLSCAPGARPSKRMAAATAPTRASCARARRSATSVSSFARLRSVSTSAPPSPRPLAPRRRSAASAARACAAVSRSAAASSRSAAASARASATRASVSAAARARTSSVFLRRRVTSRRRPRQRFSESSLSRRSALRLSARASTSSLRAWSRSASSFAMVEWSLALSLVNFCRSFAAKSSSPALAPTACRSSSANERTSPSEDWIARFSFAQASAPRERAAFWEASETSFQASAASLATSSESRAASAASWSRALKASSLTRDASAAIVSAVPYARRAVAGSDREERGTSSRDASDRGSSNRPSSHCPSH